MARYRCPGCGMPYDGKRCPACFYEPFTEEVAHRGHVHEGEPLVVKERPPVRQVPVSTGRKGCGAYPGRKKTKRPGRKWLLPLLVVFGIAAVQLPVMNLMVENVREITEEYQEPPELEVPEFEELPTVPDFSALDGYSVLYDENDVRVLASWQDGQAYSGPVMIYVENFSDRDLAVYTDPLYINGFLMGYSSYYCEAAAGETAGAGLWIDSDDLERNGIETVAEILFRLTVFDLETYETRGRNDFVRLSCAVPEGFVQNVDDSGQVLFERDGFRVICKGIQGDVCVDAGLLLLVENEGGQPADMYIAESYVNDQEAEVYLWCELQPGTRGVVSAALYNLPNLGVDRVEQIDTFALVIEGFLGEAGGDGDTWFQTDRVEIELNG